MSLIQLGKNLHSAGTWRLSFDSSEMKTGRPIDIPFPSEMTSHLETYLVEYRPLLVGGRTSKALWVSTTGEQMSEAVLAHRIKKRTRDEFGTAINPHAFRHLVATTIATYDPENATGIAAILGHASLETSERYYNLAKSVHASERFNETITDLRRRLQL